MNLKQKHQTRKKKEKIKKEKTEKKKEKGKRKKEKGSSHKQKSEKYVSWQISEVGVVVTAALPDAEVMLEVL